MVYIKVENGEIVGEVNAPVNLVLGDNTLGEYVETLNEETDEVEQVFVEHENTDANQTIYNFRSLDDKAKESYGYFIPTSASVTAKPWESVSKTEYVYNAETNTVETVLTFVEQDLDAFKEAKWIQLGDEIKAFVLSEYADYKQLSASMGLYSDEENQAIKDFVKKYMEQGRTIEVMIYGAGTHEEVDAVYWRKPVVDTEGNILEEYEYNEVLNG